MDFQEINFNKIILNKSKKRQLVTIQYSKKKKCHVRDKRHVRDMLSFIGCSKDLEYGKLKLNPPK